MSDTRKEITKLLSKIRRINHATYEDFVRWYGGTVKDWESFEAGSISGEDYDEMLCAYIDYCYTVFYETIDND